MDGTVVDYARTEASAVSAVHAAYFRDRTPLAAFAVAFHSVNDELWAAYRRHDADLDTVRVERFARLLGRFGPAGTPGLLPAVVDRFERELGRRARLHGEARAALAALRGVARLALVTDGIAAVQHAKLARVRLRGLFEPVVISTEVGYRKPDPELLRHALVRAKVAPHEALVVGDSLASDGAGAAAAGLDFCWVNRTGAARRAGQPASGRFEVPDLAVLADRLGARGGEAGGVTGGAGAGATGGPGRPPSAS